MHLEQQISKDCYEAQLCGIRDFMFDKSMKMHANLSMALDKHKNLEDVILHNELEEIEVTAKNFMELRTLLEKTLQMIDGVSPEERNNS